MERDVLHCRDLHWVEGLHRVGKREEGDWEKLSKKQCLGSRGEGRS